MPLGGMNEAEPLGLLNGVGFVLVLNPLGSINERCLEDRFLLFKLD